MSDILPLLATGSREPTLMVCFLLFVPFRTHHQPMLLTAVETVSRGSTVWESFRPTILARAKRYAAIQERLIGPDGSYPAIGRSITCRSGAFHLAEMALYLADPDKAARDLRDKLEESFRKQWQAAATKRQAAEPDAGLDAPATITFRLSPEALAEDRERPFPPNPWRI